MASGGQDDLRREIEILKHRVAELERAEMAEFRLAALVESADDAIISKALDGTIRTWNEGAEKSSDTAPPR